MATHTPTKGALPTPAALYLDEPSIAHALGVSVGWLRTDRRTKKLIPFHRIGKLVRYDLDRVREKLLSVEEGGAIKPRRKTVAA